MSKTVKGKQAGKQKVTPLMDQYNRMKAKYRDALLLFRVGDFYETFGSDAIRASEALGIVLTKRNNGGSNIELAGFPYHSLDLYLPKLVKAGFRVAICEQLEKPSKEKKIVKRGVTELITPGLNNHNDLLDNRSNNYLAAIHFGKNSMCGIAFLDSSTGDFQCFEGSMDTVGKLNQSFQPSEIIYPRSKESKLKEVTTADGFHYALDDWIFTEDYGREKLLEHFALPSLKGFGIDHMETAQVACGSIIHYLESTENRNLAHINRINRIQDDQYVWLDRFTVRNLELIRCNQAGGKSLLDILDHTYTPMGARLLRRWVVFPLTSKKRIERRHEIVEVMGEHDHLREQIIDLMRLIGDLERIVVRIPNGKANPRNLQHLEKALSAIGEIKSALAIGDHPCLVQLADQLQTCPSLQEEIGRVLVDEAPLQIGKGKVVREGYHAKLDEWRHVSTNSKDLLVDIQKNEVEKTGIHNLKIGYNQVFGYYLEVTNRYKDQGLVPDHWIRKQTLTNSERYITEELKKLESRILQADEQITLLEQKIFDELLAFCYDYIQPIQQTAQVIARLDCLINFAILAISNEYSKPQIREDTRLLITKGRHPVIERELPIGEPFIPNDILLDEEEEQILVITGPNMSGKSAILRQTALITIMAQMGSFVPAESAEIGIVDRVFTRVGASDNISSGESTFMVEMNETASILNNLTSRSLILLDEIGRGTSTYDGISIAWSIVEYLHQLDRLRPKTLFATHYHELNELANKLGRVKNYHVSVKQLGQKVIFLRKLKPGGTAHSFGIHVARMSGMPGTVIRRAHEVLGTLEEKSIGGNTSAGLDQLRTEPSYQLNIFQDTDESGKALKRMLKAVDLNTMTPIECMLKLKEMLEALDSEE